MKARLHLYSHSGPKTRAYIVAEPAALQELSRVAERAAHSLVGFDTVEFYGSDGHAYELALVSSVSESEWQQLPLPLNPHSKPQELDIVKTVDDLKKQLQPQS
jgi:hypothetical protein